MDTNLLEWCNVHHHLYFKDEETEILMGLFPLGWWSSVLNYPLMPQVTWPEELNKSPTHHSQDVFKMEIPVV